MASFISFECGQEGQGGDYSDENYDDGYDECSDGEGEQISAADMLIFTQGLINDEPEPETVDSVLNPNLDYDSDGSIIHPVRVGTSKRPLSSPAKKSPEKKKSKSAALHWCFTCFNYDATTETELQALYPETISYICYGYEVCPTTDNPHLQGYMKLTNKKRFDQVIKFFNVHPSIFVCKGTPEQNYIYCSKDGKSFELGERPFQLSKTGASALKGKKVQRIINLLLDGCSIKEDIIATDLCHTYVTNRDKIKKVVHEIKSETEMEKLRKKKEGWGSLLRLRDWQQELLAIADGYKNNDRCVIWTYDRRGGAGKSYLCRELVMQDPDNVIILNDAPTRDLSFVYEGQKMVLFDYSRTEMSNSRGINYDVIEKLKNGVMLSTKYEGKVKYFSSPQVLCFANFPPVVENLSMDRWHIYEISQSRLIVKSAEDFLGKTSDFSVL